MAEAKEAQQNVEQQECNTCPASSVITRAVSDLNLVAFEPDDNENPRNWSKRRKWMVTIVLSLYSFITLASSTLIVPALPTIAADLSINPGAESQMVMSSFILAVAFGPLLWGPLSETYGRAFILHISNIVFLIFNSLCAISQNEAQLLVFRILSGFGASSTFALYSGIINDCWNKEERGEGIAIATLIPLLGPAFGPLAAAAMLGKLSWRWVFGITSFFDVAVAIVGFLTMRETFEAVILLRRAQRLRKATGNGELHTKHDSSDRSALKLIRKNISRASLFFCTEPIIWLASGFFSVLFGVLYIFLGTFTNVWIRIYHRTVLQAGLHYLAYGLGLFVGAQGCARLSDKIYIRLTLRNHGKSCPEFRLPLILPFAILMPASLLLFGWTAQYRLHWMVPTISAFLFGIAYIVPSQCMIAYIIECYGINAASASAAAYVTRNIAGFGFPLFGPILFDRLGWGWGNSVLALILALGMLPTAFVLWHCGRRLRQASQHAVADKDDEEDHATGENKTQSLE